MTSEQIIDADKLQQQYQELNTGNFIELKVLKKLVRPFCKKYDVTESKAIRLAKMELSVIEVEKMFKEAKDGKQRTKEKDTSVSAKRRN